ncbi:MAG TPA: glycosyltransferase family 2 protein [Bradyrhizobium sp.]|nr:glycosyltransferase family 2 protein [Bradyrhizobium sp.]
MQGDFAIPGPAPAPAVSVIIATYNRAHTLRHAVQSVCNSSFSDWELIVVGDGCTDDTAQCISSFNDPRVRFVNLAKRFGHQAGPHNHGLTLARGRYVAFLNHDDFYFPDHLEKCVAELESSGADLVWVACAIANVKAVTDGDRPFAFALHGVPAAPEYTPLATYISSSWVLRRGLAQRVGPWRSPEKAYVTPSQEWLFRAWYSGATLKFLPSVTVIVVLAGPRPGSYARPISPEHELIAQWLKEDPKCRERILEEAAVNEAMGHFLHYRYPSLRSLRRMLLRPVYFLLARMGIHPLSLPIAMVFGRRGSVVRNHRRITGAQ